MLLKRAQMVYNNYIGRGRFKWLQKSKSTESMNLRKRKKRKDLPKKNKRDMIEIVDDDKNEVKQIESEVEELEETLEESEEKFN